MKDSNNKTSKSKLEELKNSSSKNNTHSKVITSSSPKQKKKKNDRFDGNLDINDKHDKISKQLNFNNLKNNLTSTSALEEDKDAEKSPSRKKVKMDLFDERIEKKKQRALMYEKYLQRGGARNPGSKEIPTVRSFIYNNNNKIYITLRINFESNVENTFLQ